jgi:catechol 2,3-dioxygenase-like lactoylglutathione lyase family enzyme
MRANGLHHLALRTAHLERSEKFYVDVLGLPVLRRFAHADGTPRSVWVDLGDGAFLALEVTSTGSPRGDDDPGWHCVALRIAQSEREAWRARVSAAGHPVERESDYTLYLRDPDGGLVALSHYPKPA